MITVYDHRTTRYRPHTVITHYTGQFSDCTQ